ANAVECSFQDSSLPTVSLSTRLRSFNDTWTTGCSPAITASTVKTYRWRFASHRRNDSSADRERSATIDYSTVCGAEMRERHYARDDTRPNGLGRSVDE